MNLQWPVLAAIAGMLTVCGTTKSARLAAVRWVLVAALTIPVLAVLIPLIELLWLAMGFSMAPAIGLLLTVLAVLVLPLLDVTREPNGWWAPVASLAIGGACLGIGILTSGADSARPAPSTLIYTYDRETGVAVWATDPDSIAGGSTAAREWATAAIGPVGEPVPLGPFMWRRGDATSGPLYSTASAAPTSAPVPTATWAVDPSSGPGSARVLLRSEIGAELVSVDLGASDAALVAVNGHPLPREAPARFVEHWGTPDGDLVLDFDVSGTSIPFRFAVVETHFRPNELVPGDPFDRPPELAPNIRRNSDRGLIRTPVVVDPSAGTVTVAGVVSVSPPADSASLGAFAPADTAMTDSVRLDSGIADSGVADSGVADSALVDAVMADSLAVDTSMTIDTTVSRPGTAEAQSATLPSKKR